MTTESDINLSEWLKRNSSYGQLEKEQTQEDDIMEEVPEEQEEI